MATPARAEQDAVNDTASDTHPFARVWSSAIAGTSYVPMSGTEVLALLDDLTDGLIEALLSDPFEAAAGTRAGEALVGCTSPPSARWSEPSTCSASGCCRSWA